MKFVKGTTKKKLVIPNTVMELSGFERGAMVELQALTDTVVILKKRMTAMEMVNAIDALQRLTVDLFAELAKTCGGCEDCGDGRCPALDRIATEVPEEVRQGAGIPSGVKLQSWPGETEGTVMVAQAEYRFDLTDVPEWVRSTLEALGVCMGNLEELLMAEEPIHGSKGGGTGGEIRTPG